MSRQQRERIPSYLRRRFHWHMSKHAIGRKGDRTSRRRTLLFVLLLGLIVAAGIEVSLQVLCALSPQVAWTLGDSAEPFAVLDEVLGQRPRPHFHDHDGRGFRNPTALATADIVCLGDSQTYGTGVERDDAWPLQLARMSDKHVYSMAFGGYGPVHSEVLLEQALQLRPELVVEAVYAGNDLWDSYNMVYLQGQSAHHATTDPAIQAALRAAQEREPLEQKITELSRVYFGKFPRAAADGLDARQPVSLRRFLSINSRSYGLARAWKRRFSPSESASHENLTWQELSQLAESSGGRWEAYSASQQHTIFVPAYRLTGLDLNDPRIQEGHRIALAGIGRMQARLSAQEVRFLVLLIPTKMLVFGPHVKAPSPTFAKLVANEQQMWAATKDYLRTQQIPHVDALGPLRAAIKRGIMPYKQTADGHPKRRGHEIIARAVCDWVENHQVQPPNISPPGRP